jgi:hypothetical protein
LNHIKFANIQIELWEKHRPIVSIFDDISNLYGYQMYGVLKRFLGFGLLKTYTWISFINCIILSSIIYELSNTTLKRFFSAGYGFALTTTSLLTVFSSIFILGVDDFSYFRAYTASAGILGFCAYLATVSMTLNIPLVRFGRLMFLVLMLGLIFFVQAIVHPQELVFSLSFFIGLVGVTLYQKNKVLFEINRKNIFYFAVFIVILFLLHFSGFLVLREVKNSVIIFSVFGQEMIFGNLFESALRVLDWSGIILVTLAFLLSRGNRDRFAVFVCCYLCATFFNPILGSIIVDASSSVSYYRFLFGSLFFLSVSIIGFSVFSSTVIKGFFAKTLGLIILLVSIAWSSDKGRSLWGVDQSEKASYWSDLLDFANGLERFKIVHTDPVTGYLLNGLSDLQFSGHKYFPDASSVELSTSNLFGPNRVVNSGEYLIINLRNGSLSGFVESSGHFPRSILDVSSKYDSVLVDQVKVAAGFERVWISPDSLVQVFLIK